MSGPEYGVPPADRWRRRCDAELERNVFNGELPGHQPPSVKDAPGEARGVDCIEFVRGFSRRVEGQCRADWSALPIMRSMAAKNTVEHTMLSQAHFITKRGRSTDSSVNEFVLAYKKLAHLLHHGFVGQGLPPCRWRATPPSFHTSKVLPGWRENWPGRRTSLSSICKARSSYDSSWATLSSELEWCMGIEFSSP